MTQKEKAIEFLKKLNIVEPQIEIFCEEDVVTQYECCIGFDIDKESALYAKIQEIQNKYGCLVYAVTHKNTAFGELYSMLVISKYKEEWEDTLYIDSEETRAFAYVWNATYDDMSEFGDVWLEARFGGIRRVA